MSKKKTTLISKLRAIAPLKHKSWTDKIPADIAAEALAARAEWQAGGLSHLSVSQVYRAIVELHPPVADLVRVDHFRTWISMK